MSDIIKANEDNDKKFWTGMEDQKKKKKDEEQQFNESGNKEEKLEYFTE